MSETKDHNFRQISESGVVAVIRANSIDHLPAITEALLAGGVVAIEVTMTTPQAIAGIAMLAERYRGRAVVGVGTVVDAATCRQAIAAGAQFVVSPMCEAEIVAATVDLGKISIPGAFTPTEIMRAWAAGADVVKVFPSTALGPGYFKDILAPLPHLRLTPTGGVDLQNAGEWIKAGAVFLGVGSAMIPQSAIAKGDWATITANAKAFVSAIRAARTGK